MKKPCILLLSALVAGCAGGRPWEESNSPLKPWGAVGEEFMVAADHPLASQAGERMLESGGNVVDAAVATSFTLAVTRPYSAGLGGGGFMMIHLKGREPVVLDYRETAPKACVPETYLDKKGDVIPGKTVRGRWAVGVPGQVKGAAYALEKYGTKSLAEVMAPAIELAEKGFPVDEHTHKSMEALARRVRKAPRKYREIARIFLKDGEPYAAGETLRQPDLARTLKLIAEKGPDVFYKGEIARAISEDMRRHGGPLTAEDLAGYEIAVRRPLEGHYRGLDVLAMPPPSSGGACLLEVLHVMDRLPKGTDKPDYYHALAESMKHAFADRAALLGDADVHPEVDDDVKVMISPEYAKTVYGAIRHRKTFGPERYGMNYLKEDHGTTHYSVMDARGDAVAATETINLGFASMIVPPGTGVVLNDELDDFTVKAGVPNEFGLVMSDRNLIRPGQRPLSSMSPTIMTKGGEAVLAAGASGGPRIITATLQTILHIVGFGERPDLAVAAPRIHHQWSPDVLYAEEGLGEEVRAALEGAGHKVSKYKSHAGVCQVVYRAGRLYGASDPRKGGRPAGR